MKEYPLISIITPTLNAEKYIDYFLSSLLKQTYPRRKMEIIIADGGSTDKTIILAKKCKAKIIKNPYVMAQPGVWVGMKKAKGELLMVLAGDNIFKDKNAIEKIVSVFQDKDIYAAFPKHDSTKSDSLFTKYINTFTDPFNHFLYGYAANARTFKKIYKVLKNNKIYDVYNFKSSPIKPILGVTQGFTVRSDFIRIWHEKNDDFIPIFKLIDKDKKIAYVHSVELFHHTVRDIEHFFRKQRWAAKNALETRNYGIVARKTELTFYQQIKMYAFPLYAFSIIIPAIRALIGLIKDKEKMWFFHPVISFISALAITYEYLRMKVGFRSEVYRL